MSAADPAPSSIEGGNEPGAAPGRFAALGLLLFLFIPAVLFLFVRHPAPLWLSLAGGVALMVGHRRLARPYFRRALARKCVWCNRTLPAAAEALALTQRSETFAARACPGHRAPAAKFFAFLGRFRLPLALGIFVPLLALLATLAAAAAGQKVPLPAVTAFFQLAIGLTVNAAALAYRFTPESPAGAALPVPFPVHNFFLLGVRTLLWIFRLVGLWWIFVGARFFLG